MKSKPEPGPAMYDQLKARLARLLTRSQPLKPQTERQLASRMAEYSADLASFLFYATEVLEEFELDIIFAAQFTPTLDDQAEVSDLLYDWQPSPEDIARLTPDLEQMVLQTVMLLPDGSEASLVLHEVMIERFVRLMRLSQAPPPGTTKVIRDALPNELWAIAGALLRQRGFTPEHQQWFAEFTSHMVDRHPVDRGILEAAAQFVSEQSTLEHESLLEAAAATVQAARNATAYAKGGHMYWSADVAQHHDYHGQGQVNEALIAQRKQEVEWLETIQVDLQTYDEQANVRT